MFSRRTISLVVVLSLVAQAMVLINTETHTSNFVEDSSLLEQVPEYGGARGGGGAIELVWDSPGSGMPDGIISMGDYLLYTDRDDDSGTRELFRSNGTAEGTGLLKDINPGEMNTKLLDLRINSTKYKLKKNDETTNNNTDSNIVRNNTINSAE